MTAKKTTDAAPDKPFDFEKSLDELEQLVEKMETGELSLEDSLKHFERGIALTRACQQALQQAEQKVQVLLNDAPDAKLKDFNPDTDTDQDGG
ncbi:MAG: exodeoxyribonuclease VII small subunit [Gammaproteobacteria bacterium]